MSLHPLRTRRLPRRIVVLVATFVLTGLFITQTTREKRIDLANSALRVPLDKLCRNRINGPTGNWLYDSNLEEKRLTKEDFESGMYKAGSRDTWVFNEEDEDVHWIGDDTDMVLEFEKSANLIDVNKLLSGNLTGRFRDNLRPELRYITGWNDGGFTNQFMGVANLIFLSLLTPTHIPIIPPLVARPHMPVRAGYRAFSDVFDLERLARSMNKEMVEWKDVKDLRGLKGSKMYDGSMKADEQDEIGCWSVWMTAKRDATKPYQGTFLPDHLNLDTHLTCFDFLYFVSASLVGFEWEQEYSSAWNFVGKYARWNDRIRSLARETLSLTLGLVRRDIMLPVRGDSDWRDDRDGRKFHAHDLRALDERDRILTPFVTIHVRHGDFLSNCEERKQDGRLCSPPLSTFEALVEEIEDELLERGRVLPHMGKLPVIVTSDETDEAWWTEVQRYGWHRVKFPEYLALPPGVKGREEEGLSEETHRKLWDRLLIEVAIQGYGTGFIGTEGSTMSLVAQRRVEHWQKGTARIVRFSIFDNWD
ncbi:hypothetical protein FRC20_002388 [Serendipita sp. 405]|nr:hypothetical protein FRC20_002388 [Serendipita sp. 405]